MKKKQLYETIMRNVAKQVKQVLNESAFDSPFYKSMPSADKNNRAIKIDRDSFVDLFKTDVAQEIIKKHNACVGFGSEDVALCMFIDNDSKSIDELELLMQNLLNELDNKTDIYIETIWAGNCGLFANKIIYRGATATDINYIMKRRDDYIDYDFQCLYGVRSKILNFARDEKHKNAKIVFKYFSHYDYKIKSSKKSTEIKLDDVKQDILAAANNYIKPKYGNSYNIDLEEGKRQCDNASYEAFVIRYKNEYMGLFKISQNQWGDCKLTYAAPLAGESSYTFNIENDYIEELKHAIDFICN